MESQFFWATQSEPTVRIVEPRRQMSEFVDLEDGSSRSAVVEDLPISIAHELKLILLGRESGDDALIHV